MSDNVIISGQQEMAHHVREIERLKKEHTKILNELALVNVGKGK